jgi:hypothetical protein
MRTPRYGVALSALATAIALAVLLVGAPPAHADGKPAYRVDDPTLVYLGNPRLFKKPCVVSADRVYRAIPEYREILEKNLTEKDVRYHFLMKRASDKFGAAVKDLARDLGHDLVAATGAVAANTADAPPVPDCTDAAIQRLPA